MGKGKKKGAKGEGDSQKSELPSLSGLTIRDQPSTSSGRTTAPLETVESKDAKVKEPQGLASETLSSVTAPTVTPAAPVTSETHAEDKEDEGGLGLGGGKKRRPRKKKDKTETPSAAQAAPPSQAAVPPVQSAVQSATPSTQASVPPATTWVRPPATFHPPSRPAATFPPPPHPAATFPSHPHPAATFSRPSGPAATFPPPPHPAATFPSHPHPAATFSRPPRPAAPFLPPGPPPGFPAPSFEQPAFSPTPSSSQSPLEPYPGVRAPPSDGVGRGKGRGQQPSVTPGGQSKAVQGQGDVRGLKEPEVVLCRYKIPAKIEGRTIRSMPVKVLSNYLPMTIKPYKIYRYDVSFKPDRPKKLIPKAFEISKKKNFPKHVIAFDQSKNCYSLQALPGVTQTDRFITKVELIDMNGKTMCFEVSYKGTGQVDLQTINDYMKNGTSLSPPTEAIQCIDVVLRQGTLESYIKAGRQFFKRPAKPIDLGYGLEMWTGLFQSAIFTSRPFINIDVAHKGFPKQQRLIDAMAKDFRLDLSKPVSQHRPYEREAFEHFIKGLRVIAKVGGDIAGQKREFICNGLSLPPRESKFVMTTPDGKTKNMTVEEYFTKEKKIRLQYPYLDCMWVGPRDKTIYYPLELLDIVPGQALNKQLNETQLATMVREAATPPVERKAKIEEVIRDMNYSQNPYFKQFGLDIKTEFHPVNARVLQAPRLDMGGPQKIDPRRGVWQANRLLKPEPLESWGFVALEANHENSNADMIINLFKSVGSRMGMRISEPKERFYNVRINDLSKMFYKAQQMEIKFLVVVVSGREKDYYHKVKKAAELEVGILTQCIKQYTAQRRMNDQTARNILLKVNAKLMGINQSIDNSSMPKCLADGEVMIVGADVTHPSPEQSSVPSIAAVTASIDPRFFNFNIQMSVQTPKKEMIVEFEEMIEEHLRVFKEKQKKLPKKIFIFRDGVSEGQFAQVLNSELQAVHNAYRRMAGPQARPQVLLLLVQKRHHTRLFLGPNIQNVEPGTVVDTDIVHARELDFYLVSHQAIKGTARPARYHAVCNDGQIPHDEVEQLTYYLCHLYARCTRAVSYPTPTYYAHLACLRARSLTYGEKFNNVMLESKPQRLKVLDKVLQTSRMFFV